MQETWEAFYDLMKAQFAGLLFEREAAATPVELELLHAWLVQHELGPRDLKRWFTEGGPK